MQKILNNLKLVYKIHITFYISIVLIVFSLLMFNYFSNTIKNNLLVKYDEQKNINVLNNEISDNLRLLDFYTINMTLKQNNKKLLQKKAIVYQSILSNLQVYENISFIHENKEFIQLTKKIKTRLAGYNIISNSIEDELNNGFEDAMYVLLSLSTTSNIISKELNQLSLIVEKNLDERLEKENEYLNKVKIFLYITIAIIFLIMLYLNRIVAKSILNNLVGLKENITSFFDLLAKKRDSIIHIEYKANDEIGDIAKIIGDNMYISEKILHSEREEAIVVENKVKEVTKEILKLNNELEDTQREVVFTMGIISEERSKETGYHVKRVAEYSFILARLYGLSLEESVLLKNASPMHDVGKIAIPDAILNKPGRFNDEEFEIMKNHAELGYKMLNHSDKSILKAASIVAYEHHEKWNGKGYPRGLKGEEIHIYGRITAIADVFDALGSDRVYKKAWPLDKILNLFEEERGEHFDPELVDLFLDYLEHFLAAKENIENNGSNLAMSKYLEDFNKVDSILDLP